jgi:hypothetical protein
MQIAHVLGELKGSIWPLSTAAPNAVPGLNGKQLERMSPL